MNIFELLFFLLIYVIGFVIGTSVIQSTNVLGGAFVGFLTSYFLLMGLTRMLGKKKRPK
jgi:hypothetical protein